MTETLRHFFVMGGYGSYVFSAYGSVIIFLACQWFHPWRRWRKYLHQQRDRYRS